jgi:diguanylate cyclase (GGDEF)-like protein
MMGSFKVRLAVYFALVALLPFAAAFQGFHSLTRNSETRRVDAVLQSGLRSASVAYEDDLARTQHAATMFASNRDLQRALLTNDRGALARIVRAVPNLRVDAGRLSVGHTPTLAATRGVSVRGSRGRLAEVIAALPIDAKLARSLERRAGLEPEQRIVFVERGRVVAGAGPLGARPVLQAGHSESVELGGTRYRAIQSGPLGTQQGTRILILAPQSAIDRASASTEKRLALMMLITLVLLILIAYFEGRSIVGRLGGFAGAANDIARGRFDSRVQVKGRDEFARLSLAFNEMADELEARQRELDEERRRLREATMRFGEALAATHDSDELLRVFVETAVESTGALGGVFAGEHGELVRKGNPDAGARRLESPVTAGEETFGTLILSGEEFTQEQEETADWLAGHAATALGNARFHRAVRHQALVDGLTGLANRRPCEDALKKEVVRAKRLGDPLAVIVADLDDFKAVNDKHGHPTGDKVLREFAEALKASVREIDLPSRWGGEEFVVVLPGTDEAGGAHVAERIRREFARRVVLASSGEQIISTASFGVVGFAGRGGTSELLGAADAALYRAKRAGKDRIATAEGPDKPDVKAATLGA